MYTAQYHLSTCPFIAFGVLALVRDACAFLVARVISTSQGEQSGVKDTKHATQPQLTDKAERGGYTVYRVREDDEGKKPSVSPTARRQHDHGNVGRCGGAATGLNSATII